MREHDRLRVTAARFLLFLVLFLAIVGVIASSPGVFLIAPPYAVTAYLIVFGPRERYAQPRNIVASYLVVLGSSAAFESVLGIGLVALALNVAVVALFIAFSGFAHPPALALTIFSYIVHDPVTFTLTSLIVLLIVVGIALVFARIPAVQRVLDEPAG